MILDQRIIFQLAAQEVSHPVQAMTELLHFIGQSIGLVDTLIVPTYIVLLFLRPIYHEVGSLCIIPI